MGVKQGAKALFSITGLALADVCSMIKGLAKERGLEKPRVTVDCNNVVHVYQKSRSKTGSVANLLQKFSSRGIVMEPVADGEARPACKQASNERVAKMDKHRVKAFQLRKSIRQTKQRIAREELAYTQRLELHNEMQKMQKACKSSESQSQSHLPKNFAQELEHELDVRGAHESNEDYGSVEEVVVAGWQADTYMVSRLVSLAAIMALTKDSDIPLLAGDGGIAIKSFTKGKFELVCPCEATLKNAMKHLPSGSKAKFHAAELPIFEGVKSHRLRALMMIICGCDVYQPGMKGVKITKLAQMIEEMKAPSEEALYLGLFHALKAANGLDDDVIDTLIDAIIYEPTNPAADESDEENPASTYMFDAPSLLPKYLEEFSVDDKFQRSCIFPGPEISVCKGVGEHGHRFLSAVGASNCSMCKEVVCAYCQEMLDEKVHCLTCFATESIVPKAGCPNAKSTAKMRQELTEDYDFDSVEELTSDEVEDVYEMMAFMRQYRTLEESVKFPLYETAEMDSETPTEWEEILELDLKEGGTFLAEPDLDAKHIPGVLHLFSSLVRFEPGKKTEWMRDPAIFESLPALFVNHAFNSRVDSGYRLLMRCVRHSIDSRTPPIETNTAVLVEHKGDIGISLRSKIPASMKQSAKEGRDKEGMYQTGIVATANDILCCKCTCQCGSQNDQRVVCVHNLPLLFLLTLLLIEDLAEHILLELAACMRGNIWDKSVWSEEDEGRMKESIVTLMEAAGEAVGVHDADTSSIDDLLHKFSVGTDKRREWKQRVKTPPKPSELGPIYSINFMSSAKIASNATKRRHTDSNAKDDGEEQEFDESDMAFRLAKKLKERGSYAPTFPWVSLGIQCGVCFNSLPHGVSFLNGPLQAESTALADNDVEMHADDPPVEDAAGDDVEMHPAGSGEGGAVADPIDEVETFTPDYLRVTLLMDAAKCESAEKAKFVGIKLLNSRSDGQRKEKTRQEHTELSKAVERDWRRLKQLAEKRSIRGIATKIDNLGPQKGPRANAPSPSKAKGGSRATPRRSKIHQRGRPGPPMRKKVSYRCGKCSNNNVNSPGLRFHCVPKFPAELRAKKPALASIIKREGQILLRRETMDRVCGDRDCKTKKYVCEEHSFEVVLRSRPFTYRGEERTQSYYLTVPTGAGRKSSSTPAKTLSKGTARDRAIHRLMQHANQNAVEPGLHAQSVDLDDHLQELQSEEITSDAHRIRNLEEQNMIKDAQLELASSDLARATKAVQQMAEENSPEKHLPMNPSLGRAAGLESAVGNAESVVVPGRHFFHADPNKSSGPRRFLADDSPAVRLGMPDWEVKRRTGFPSEEALLSYIFVMCNGDVDVITKRETSLTWWEEWFISREFIWNRARPRYIDVKAEYGLHPRDAERVLIAKTDIEFRALASWPLYASYEEDRALRNEKKWGRKYEGSRPIMWDMTNISAYAFSDADLQRITYSQYYGENCFKGGVGTQLCGYQIAANLWTGGVSDSDYNRREGYLQRQRKFQEEDLVQIQADDGALTEEVVPFLNIYDKGYRAKLAAWRNGKQRALQPDWAKSDRRFNRSQTINSASVASDRGGNERSVNVSKRAGLISKGFQPNMDPKRFNKTWRNWSFQANFMFEPVL